MTSTELYATTANQVRVATEKAAESFKKNARAFTDQAEAVATLPAVDLTTPVQRYFDLIQQTVDANREFATRWAELVTSLSHSFLSQAQTFGNVVKEQTTLVADLVVEQAETAEQVAKDQAAHAEQAEKDLMKQVEKAEREAAKIAHEEARSPYQGLTKAELAEKLIEQDLPKSGTVDELIDRLVSANYR